MADRLYKQLGASLVHCGFNDATRGIQATASIKVVNDGALWRNATNNWRVLHNAQFF